MQLIWFYKGKYIYILDKSNGVLENVTGKVSKGEKSMGIKYLDI